MSTRVAENRQHTLVPCDHMATEQTAVVGRALQDRRTGACDIKDGKDTDLRNKEVIPTVDLSVEVKRRESEQEQISMRSGSQQEVNQDKVHANQQTETVVESPFTTVIPTETTVREEADSNSVLSTGGSERVFTAMQMCNSSFKVRRDAGGSCCGHGSRSYNYIRQGLCHTGAKTTGVERNHDACSR